MISKCDLLASRKLTLERLFALTNADLNKWRINYCGIEKHDLCILHPRVDEIIYTITSFNDIDLVSEAQLRQARQICDDLSKSYLTENQRLAAAFINSAQNFFPIVKVKAVGEKIKDPYKCQNFYNFLTNKGPDGFIEHQLTTKNLDTMFGIVALLQGENIRGKYGDPSIQIIFDYAQLAKKMISQGVGGFVPTILLTLAGST